MERTLVKKKNMRQLKVYSKYRSYDVRYPFSRDPCNTKTIPEIRLQGEWLRKLGFEEGCDIMIMQMPKILIITLNEEKLCA